jgi:hypothetical protein
VRRIPVIDDERRLIGMISQAGVAVRSDQPEKTAEVSGGDFEVPSGLIGMTLESSGARTSILAAALACQPLLYMARVSRSWCSISTNGYYSSLIGLLIASPL